MRVLLFGRALGPGGAERQMALLAAGLQRRGHEVTVATFYPGGRFLSVVADAGAAYVSLEKRGRWDVVGFLLRFRRLLVRAKPDIVYSFLPAANIVALAMTRGRSRPRCVWGVRVSDMRLENYGWLERFVYTAERRLARVADLVIFNARSGLRQARARGMAPRNGVVVANGIDTAAFMPDETARRTLREAWGVADEETLVGLVARFDPMKDHRTLFAAVRATLGKHPAVRLVLAGAGIEPSNGALLAMLRAAGLEERTLLLGERSDMPALMAALDILCLSSAYGEGFPNVLGEAMATGVPCVATDVGDCRDVVGDTGIIVPPEDAAALTDGIDRLLARLAASGGSLRDSARRRIVENFSIDSLLCNTERYLLTLLGPRCDGAGDR